MSYDEDNNLAEPDSFYEIMNPGFRGRGKYTYQAEKIGSYLLVPVNRDEISSKLTINPEKMQEMLDAYDRYIKHEKTKTDTARNMVMRALYSHFSPNNSEWARLCMRATFPALGEYAEHIDLFLPDVELATLWRAILYRLQKDQESKKLKNENLIFKRSLASSVPPCLCWLPMPDQPEDAPPGQ